MNPETIVVTQEDGRDRRRVGGSERDTPPRPPTSIAPESFVGPETVREFLAFESIETIYRLCRSGMPHRRIGRNLRFRLSEIEHWLAHNAEVGSDDDGVLLDEVPPTAERSPWLT